MKHYAPIRICVLRARAIKRGAEKGNREREILWSKFLKQMHTFIESDCSSSFALAVQWIHWKPRERTKRSMGISWSLAIWSLMNKCQTDCGKYAKWNPPYFVLNWKLYSNDAQRFDRLSSNNNSHKFESLECECHNFCFNWSTSQWFICKRYARTNNGTVSWKVNGSLSVLLNRTKENQLYTSKCETDTLYHTTLHYTYLFSFFSHSLSI